MYLDIINTVITTILSNTDTHITKTHLSYRCISVLLLLLYYILYLYAMCCLLHICALFFFFVGEWVCVDEYFWFFHFFYTNWWLFTALVHHMLTERMFQTRNHHSQHMHTTDSFNICFCSSCCFCSFFLLSCFISLLYSCWVEERWEKKYNNISHIHRSSFSYNLKRVRKKRKLHCVHETDFSTIVSKTLDLDARNY